MTDTTLTLGDMEVTPFIDEVGNTSYELHIDNGVEFHNVRLDKDQLDNLIALLSEVDTEEDYYRLT